jgi:hypothetical protein
MKGQLVFDFGSNKPLFQPKEEAIRGQSETVTDVLKNGGMKNKGGKKTYETDRTKISDGVQIIQFVTVTVSVKDYHKRLDDSDEACRRRAREGYSMDEAIEEAAIYSYFIRDLSTYPLNCHYKVFVPHELVEKLGGDEDRVKEISEKIGEYAGRDKDGVYYWMEGDSLTRALADQMHNKIQTMIIEGQRAPSFDVIAKQRFRQLSYAFFGAGPLS